MDTFFADMMIFSYFLCFPFRFSNYQESKAKTTLKITPSRKLIYLETQATEHGLLAQLLADFAFLRMLFRIVSFLFPMECKFFKF